MAVLLAPKLYLGKYDLSGFANQTTPSRDVEKKDSTTFADAGKKRVEAGFETTSLKAKVFWRANSASFLSHDILAESWKVAGVPVSFSMVAGAAGDPVMFFKALEAAYTCGGQVGEHIMSDVEAVATGDTPCIYGTVLDVGAKSTGGSGTAMQLGLVGAAQKLYAALHVTAATGTLTLKIQSDDNAGFSSPTDRLTFTGASAAGWQWLELAGAVATDTYWRSSYTLPSGTATFALHVGIL